MRILLAFLSLCLAGLSGAQLRFSPPMLESAPVLDGVISPDEWPAAAELSPLLDKVDGTAFPARTRIFVAIRGADLYVAAACESPAGPPVARSRQPNSQMEGEDLIRIVLDPFARRTYSGISSFNINPFGAQSELLAGGRAAKREWRGDWQAAAKVREGGWDVEVRIPWRMLDRPGGIRDVQFNVLRYDARLDRTGWWSNRGLRDLPESDGVLAAVPLPAPEGGPQLDLLAYGLAEYDKDEGRTSTFRSGVDVRYRPNSQITSLLSVSPDFRSIEQAVEQIGFTRTERSQADARPFFTEGAGFFRVTPGFSFGNLFYTRRIEDFDVGVKAFGSASGRDQFGVLAVRDGGDQTAAVARWLRQLDSRSSASVYATHAGSPGDRASAFGTNLDFGRGNFDWGGQYASSEENGLEDGAASVNLDYAVPRLYSTIRWYETGENFRPPLSLIGWRDRTGAYWYTDWLNPMTSGPLREWQVEIYGANFAERGGGNQERGGDVDASILLRSDIRIGMGIGSARYLDENENEVRGEVIVNESNRQRQFGIFMASGRRGPSGYSILRGGASWRFGRGIDASLDYFREDYQGIQDQAILGLGWEMNAAESISARLVREDGEINAYLAYRKAGFKGLEYYFILGDPNASETRTRAAIKVVWAG